MAMILNPNDWLGNLKPGDIVFISSSYSMGWNVRLATVERLTKTMVILKGESRRYNLCGSEIGAGSRTSIIEYNDCNKQHYEVQQLTSQFKSLINHFERSDTIRSLTPEQLKKLVACMDGVKAEMVKCP